MKNTSIYYLVPVLFSFMFLSCLSSTESETDTTAATASMEFRFTHTVDGAPLEFDTKNYTNSAGNIFTVGQLKYHISDFKIKDDNGDVIDSSLQALAVNARESTSPSFIINNLAPIHFHTVNFTISAVDPMKKSASSLSAQDFFIMDISVNVQDPAGVMQPLSTKLNGSPLIEENNFIYRSGGLHTMLVAGKTIVLDIELDVMKIFNAPNVIDFTNHLSAGSLNSDADSQKMLRDNIRKSAFEVVNVQSM